MLKKTITYNDCDGNPITEEFRFNISRAEWAEMSYQQGANGVEWYLNKLLKSRDTGELFAFIKELILTSIGKQSADNKSFIKNQQIRDSFMYSEAYSELLEELMSSEKAASEFFNAVLNIPKTPTEGSKIQQPTTETIQAVAEVK